jgi:hypothetical protein
MFVDCFHVIHFMLCQASELTLETFGGLFFQPKPFHHSHLRRNYEL